MAEQGPVKQVPIIITPLTAIERFFYNYGVLKKQVFRLVIVSSLKYNKNTYLPFDQNTHNSPSCYLFTVSVCISYLHYQEAVDIRYQFANGILFPVI